jgi:hypothetical protein
MGCSPNYLNFSEHLYIVLWLVYAQHQAITGSYQKKLCMSTWALWQKPVMLFMKMNISQHIILIEWVDNNLNSIHVEGIERKNYI